jgi:hypothetical protein
LKGKAKRTKEKKRNALPGILTYHFKKFKIKWQTMSLTLSPCLPAGRSFNLLAYSAIAILYALIKRAPRFL